MDRTKRIVLSRRVRDDSLFSFDGKVVNASGLRASWLADISERANATVSKVLQNFGLSLPSGWVKWIAEISAILYFATHGLEKLKNCVMCVYKFFTDYEQKRTAEKNEVSIRERSERISVRDVTLCGPLKVLPAPEWVLVRRDAERQPQPSETVKEMVNKGTIVQVGYGHFVASENKYVEHIFERQDRVLLKGEGMAYYLTMPDGREILHYLYHFSCVLAVLMP